MLTKKRLILLLSLNQCLHLLVLLKQNMQTIYLKLEEEKLLTAYCLRGLRLKILLFFPLGFFHSYMFFFYYFNCG